MNMSRRTFILSTGLVAVAPSIASELTKSPNAGLSGTAQLAGLRSDPPVTGSAGNDLLFRIDGWEPREEMAMDAAQSAWADKAIQRPADEPLWISINQSWRATWL